MVPFFIESFSVLAMMRLVNELMIPPIAQFSRDLQYHRTIQNFNAIIQVA